MSTADKIRTLRLADPNISAAEMARKVGVSRERVRQILEGLGLPSKVTRARKLMTRTEYLCWWNMIDRCRNPQNGVFKNYGARGISACPQWAVSFAQFFKDMGPRPSLQHSIDRINNDGNYEPSNCRWATKAQQEANKRPRRRKAGKVKFEPRLMGAPSKD